MRLLSNTINTIILCVLMHGISSAATISIDCSSASVVNSAINAAASGDTLQCTSNGVWESTVMIPSTKGIIIDGNGKEITRSTSLESGAYLIDIDTNSSQNTIIKNFNFVSTEQSFKLCGFINVGGNVSSAPFVINNNTFTSTGLGCGTSSPSTSLGIMINITDRQYGVIHSNIFNSGPPAECIHVQTNSTDGSAWTEEDSEGTSKFVFIEDNIFQTNCDWIIGNTKYQGSTFAVQNFSSARTVFRYNDITGMSIDFHGRYSEYRGPRFFEIYNNTFRTGSPHDNLIYNQGNPFVIRGGSGFIYNNYYIPTSPWEIGTAVQFQLEQIRTSNCCTNYPCSDQQGRGIGGAGAVSDTGPTDEQSSPIYIWGNSINEVQFVNDSDVCGNGLLTESFVVANRDYYLLEHEYISYTYPHPLRAQYKNHGSPKSHAQRPPT